MKSLALLSRPKVINDVIGQKEVKEFLNKCIEKNFMPSIILFGPPGIGKTSLAYSICNELKVTYSYFNAAIDSKSKLVDLIKINDFLIIDEIHRMNKDKQDILLPNIENGRIKVITSTTENPYFVINPAVRSRMHILELKPIEKQDIVDGLKNVIKNNSIKIKISAKILEDIAEISSGDFRYSLNILEILSKLYPNKTITKKILSSIVPSVHFISDKNGQEHYNLLSAFHKSLRGSDVDASLYYLARLIKSGDILGMERRLWAVVYEDIGLANPNMGIRLSAAMEATKKLGFPEAKLPLGQIVIEIAKADKSNSGYVAINSAMNLVESSTNFSIPLHLNDAHYKSAAKLGKGVGYKYPHDYDYKLDQEYLPKELKGTKFYNKKKTDKI